jgi:hypothetical protein
MTYSFVSYSDTQIKVTEDTREYIYKKVYCTTSVDGDYFIFSTHNAETGLMMQQYKLLYTDCSAPSEASASALKTAVDAIINSYIVTEITDAMLDAKFGTADWTIIGRSGGTWNAIVGSQPADGDPYMIPTITYDDGFYWNNFKSIFNQSYSPSSEGAIIYSDATNWQTLAAGSAGQVLTVNSDVPSWQWNYSQINVFALTYNPADGQTAYIGNTAAAPTTTAAQRRIYANRDMTIAMASVRWYAATVAGSNENISVYIRVNNTTDTLIATIGTTAAEKHFNNTGLSISLTAGDYFEIKIVQPTWVTNPTGVLLSGYVTIY